MEKVSISWWNIPEKCFLLQGHIWRGDGRKPKRGTNCISTGTKIAPVGPWGPRKIFLASKMMSFQPNISRNKE